MTQSTNAQICFGILLDDDNEFPWLDEQWNDDIDGWWLYQQGYEPIKQCYDENGEKIKGISEQDVEYFWGERRSFLNNNPMPVEIVQHCSCDYPMYILAIKGTFQDAGRGYPLSFKPEELILPEQFDGENDANYFLKYWADKWGLTYTGQASWYLSSLWC